MPAWAFARRAVLVTICVYAGTAGAQATRDSVVARGFGADDLKGVPWRSVGPANMGGRVSAIALVPGSRTKFYVGYGTGGLWKTENLGVTFAPVFDSQPNLSIGAVEVADAPADWPGWKLEPADTAATPKAAAPRGSKKKPQARTGRDARVERGKGKIVWVGTGEGNGRNSSSWGNGVYRSTDAGATWKHLGLDATHDIPRLAVDPRDPDVCYVAALGHLWGANPERGIYKTTDGGATWQHVLRVDDATGACDVVLDPQKPSTVYAALYARRRTPWSFSGTSTTGGVFRSDDAGRTWRKLTSGLPVRTGRIGLAVHPADAKLVYAVVESDDAGAGRDPFEDRSGAGGLFKSSDRGETWTRTSPWNFRPFYFARIALDPEDLQRVYLPGWDLAISDDGGSNFRRSGSPAVHVDMHAIVVNPVDPKQVLIGNDGGLYISHDRAVTWDYRNNVAAGQFYRVAVDDSDPYRVGGGLQDNGTWIGPSQTSFETMDDDKDGFLNEDWRLVYFGDGFGLAFDPTDRHVVYATSQGGYLGRVRLDDNGGRFLRASPREGQERLRYNWNAPFLVSRHDPTVLYHGANRVVRYTERGNRWTLVSPDLTLADAAKTATVGSDAETYGTITTLAESPLRKGLLWAGTDDGRVQVTENDGKAWRDVTPAQVGGLYVARIAASNHDFRTAYVAVDGHRSDVFRPLVLATDDLGQTWREITGDLPATDPVKCVTEDLGAPQVLYCGTERGCYATLDRGISWVRLNGKSLPPVAVDDLVQHPRTRDLVAGTHGRSIWILDGAGFFAALTPARRAQALAVFAPPTAAQPRLRAGRAYGAGQGIFRAKNPPAGAAIDFWVRDAAGESATITVADSTGWVVRELSAVCRRGVNRVVWDLAADRKHLFQSVDEDQLGVKQFVAPGSYKVKVKVGDDNSETTLRVLAAPDPDR
jgi:photosystem II stability/assembly factor-like uncharacterized protein